MVKDKVHYNIYIICMYKFSDASLVCLLACMHFSRLSLSFSPCLAFLFKGRERGGAEFNVYFSLNELLLLTSRVIACDSFLCFHIIVRPETFNDFHKSSHSALFCPTKISTITSILLCFLLPST